MSKLFFIFVFIISSLMHGAIVPTDKVGFDCQTTDATQTVCYSETIPDNEDWIVRVQCQAVKSDRNTRGSWDLEQTFFRKGGGGATKEGITSILHEQSGSPYDLVFGVNGNNFEILVTGLASETINWSPCTRFLELKNK